MTAVLNISVRADSLRVTLCGSYRRDPAGLRRVYDDLAEQFDVLSPSSVDFIDPSASFVRLRAEEGEAAIAIEERHLAAIRNSDFVWLFAPDGHVGSSAALEVGYAYAIGVPIYSNSLPEDEVIASMVNLVRDYQAPSGLRDRQPGQPLAGLQSYYLRVAARRGWDGESPRDTLLLLTEELGELARAVRKSEGLMRDGAYGTDPVALELADVQLYLVHLANALGVDLSAAVTAKEAINETRFASRTAAA